MSWLDVLKSKLGLGPGQQRFVEHRATFRIKCSLPVDVQSGKSALVGRAVNLSSRGAKLELSQPLKKTSRVEVLLKGRRPTARGAKQAAELRLKARVIWCRRRQRSEDWEMGLEFVDYGTLGPGDVLAFLRHELAVQFMDDRQRRQSMRLARRMALEFTTPPREHRRKGFVKDISRSGVLLLAREALPLRTDILLWVDIDPPSPPIHAHGIVRRCNKVPGEEWWEIASPLLDVSEEDKLRLANLIARFLKDFSKD